MDLSDLYTPQELAEQRIGFLERILSFYDEAIPVAERARVVGHKLRGTGGNLGLSALAQAGSELQRDALSDVAEARLDQALQSLRPRIEAALDAERRILAA